LKAQEIVDEALAAQRHAPELRVVATMFDKRLNIAREVLIAMQARFGERLFDTAIRSSAKLREAAGAGVPIQVLAPRSSAAQDFAALAQELTLAAVGA
jgi:cellulose biosynthesis protein BcsQ